MTKKWVGRPAKIYFVSVLWIFLFKYINQDKNSFIYFQSLFTVILGRLNGSSSPFFLLDRILKTVRSWYLCVQILVVYIKDWSNWGHKGGGGLKGRVAVVYCGL